MSLNTTIILGSCLLLFSQIPAADSVVPSPDRLTFSANNPFIGSVPVQNPVWTTSPQIYTPVAMDRDAQERVWVTEGIDHGKKPVIAAGQSIIVMEDKYGKADSPHVFVTDKELRAAPLGMAVFDHRIVVSATPFIIIHTDLNRNAVFDPAIDTLEVILTGFLAGAHDHTSHAVVGAPGHNPTAADLAPLMGQEAAQ